MRRYLLLPLLLLPGCLVDVPELDSAAFACTGNGDCADGYVCHEGTCINENTDFGACDAGTHDCPDDHVCVLDAQSGFRCETCDQTGGCGDGPRLCVQTTGVGVAPYVCINPCDFGQPCDPGNGLAGRCGTMPAVPVGVANACGQCPNTCNAGQVCVGNADASDTGNAAICGDANGTIGLALGPPNPAVAVGGTVQLDAIATLGGGGTENVNNEASWSSTDDAVATVSNSGLVTGESAGTVAITADARGRAATVSVVVTTDDIDYIVTNPVWPAGGAAGSNFTGEFTVRNGGGTDGANDLNWTVYSSLDDILGVGDTPLTNDTLVGGLSAGASQTVTYSGNWGATPGTFHLIIEVTAAVDVDRSNNSVPSGPIVVSTSAGPDYRPLPVSVPTDGFSGNNFSATFRIENIGPVAPGTDAPWTLYRSDNATLDVLSDFYLTGGDVPPVAAGGLSADINGGENWPGVGGVYHLKIKVSHPNDTNVNNDIWVSPPIRTRHAGRIIAVTSSNEALVSDDNGGTWTSSALGAISGNRSVATDGLGHWVAVGNNTGIVYSADDGQSWQAASVEATNSGTLHSVAWCPSAGGAGAWVVGGDVVATVGLHFFSGDGITFGLASELIAQAHYAVACDPATPGRWLATSSDSSHVSTDNGQSWTRGADMPTSGISYRGLSWAGPVAGRTHIAVGSGGSIARSTDAGLSWFDATPVGAGTFLAVAGSPGREWLAVGPNNDAYRSVPPDDGANWIQVSNPGTTVVNAVVYHPGSGNFIAGDNNGFIYSFDPNTGSWLTLRNGGGYQVYGLAVSP